MNPERRRQGIRKAQRVVRLWRNVGDDEWYDDGGGLVKRLTNCRVPCSGPCCGNPRRWFGERTIQERKADEAMRAQLELVA